MCFSKTLKQRMALPIASDRICYDRLRCGNFDYELLYPAYLLTYLLVTIKLISKLLKRGPINYPGCRN